MKVGIKYFYFFVIICPFFVQYDGEEDERQIRSLDTTIGLKYSLQGNSDLNVTKIRPKQLIRDDEKEVEVKHLTFDS